MTEDKTSKAQIKASRKWEYKNRKKSTIDNYKRTARMFIKKHAKIEDLDELMGLIEEKKKELEK
ncbi:MAG: hypothetical protein PUG22_04640 [Peptoniphilaceae bacterium]|nr:hypothetical protein [Peptoniphilaceae bacterium]